MTEFMEDIQREGLKSSISIISILLAIVIGTIIQYEITNILLFVTFVLVTFTLLSKLIQNKLNRTNQDWVRILAEFTVPILLGLLFGFGGIISYFIPSLRNKFGITYEANTLFLMSLFIFWGGLTYIFGFNLSFRDTPPKLLSKRKISKDTVLVLVTLFLVFDWYIRFDQIIGGVYFAWLTPFAESVQAINRSTNALYQIHSTIAPIILPLLIYFYINSSKKWPFLIIILIQSLLILMGGQRRNFLLIMYAISASFMAIKRMHFRSRIFIYLTTVVVIFVFLVNPLITNARLYMRYESEELLSQPSQILVRYLFDYIPRVIRYGGFSGQSILNSFYQQNIALFERLGSYMSYSASINQAIINGKPLPSMNAFINSLSLVIPRIIFPKKPAVDANDRIFSHYSIGQVGRDATGTPVADIFGYMHVFGIIILMLVAGVGFGFIARYLRHSYGQIGDVIMIGIVPSALPVGDAFGGYLANLRNVIMIIILMEFLLVVFSKVFIRNRYCC